MNINIIPIGSGSTGNSIYIEMDNHPFLIDMGIGYRKVDEALKINKRNIQDIEAIFVTHGHNDHIKAAQAISNHTDCKIYCHESAMYSLRKINSEKIKIEPDNYFEPIEGIKVKSFSIPHDYVKTFAYIFETDKHKLSYITDCGKMNDKIMNNLIGSDVIIIESNHDVDMLKNGPYPKWLQQRILSEYGHLSNDDCSEVIETLYENGTRNFLLAHLSRHNNTPELALSTVSNRMKDKNINIYVCPETGNDFLHY